jgi:hypothetical protein
MLKCDELPSNFAFEFNLSRYTKGGQGDSEWLLGAGGGDDKQGSACQVSPATSSNAFSTLVLLS